MRARINRTGLAVAIGLLCVGTRAAAQPPPEPPAAPERRGSPVETLEALTGGRAREGGDEIETDRDSFTPATTVAGRGRFVLESAYSFIDNRRVKETHSFPELLLRYGLTDRVELRLGWNAEIGGAGSEVTGSSGGEIRSRSRGASSGSTTCHTG